MALIASKPHIYNSISDKFRMVSKTSANEVHRNAHGYETQRYLFELPLLLSQYSLRRSAVRVCAIERMMKHAMVDHTLIGDLCRNQNRQTPFLLTKQCNVVINFQAAVFHRLTEIITEEKLW